MAPQFLGSLTAAVALLATLSSAAPSQAGHRHVKHQQQKRDLVVVTVTNLVYKTVDVTTTVWIDPDYTPTVDSYASAASPTIIEVTTSAEAVPAYTPETTTTTSSSTEAAAAAYTPQPTTLITTTAAAAAYTVAVSSSAEEYAAAAATTAATSSDASSSTYTGDITFYDTEGTSACGDSNIDGYSYNAIALPYGFMGTASNDNPYCGKTITIKNGDKTATGTVIDKCMGCTGMSIDLSRHLFDELADEAEGRVTGVEWWFS